MIQFLELLTVLVFVHFLADFPLQGQYLSDAKNVDRPLAGVPWPWPMVAHCTIHAVPVWLLTGNPFLGVCEFLVHFWLDVARCSGHITFAQDQSAHLGAKVFWAAWAVVRPM